MRARLGRVELGTMESSVCAREELGPYPRYDRRPMSVRHDAAIDVLDHLYATLLEPSRWEHALGAFARLLGARAAGIRVEQEGIGVRQEWVGLEPSFERAYLEHYWRDDPWASRVWERNVGAFAHGEALASRALVERSAYHNELALPAGFDALTGGVLARGAGRVTTLAAIREKGRGGFDEERVRLAARVAPHFERVLVLRDRIDAPLVAPRSVPEALPFAARVEELLRRDHRLTATEARVAALVGRGRSPKEIAATQGSSWNTVRAQLRQIFDKTGCRSQSALARLVTLTEARLAADDALSSR